MKKAFICSPFRGDIEGNTKRATYYAQITAGADEIPIVPHLYFPIFLDENDPNQRMKGIEMGLELMDMCDEVWVFGFKITEGMRFELEHAREKESLSDCMMKTSTVSISVLWMWMTGQTTNTAAL